MDEPIKALSNTPLHVRLWGRKGQLLFIAVFTLFHLVLTVSFFLWSFSLVLGKMDNGGRLTAGEGLIVNFSDIFLWPVFVPLSQVDALRQVLPAWSAVVILLLNSLVWALAAWGVVSGIKWFHTKRIKALHKVISK